MSNKEQSLETLHDIKKMMEQSSRFISLSGISGVAAGTCALIGAWFARHTIIHSTNLAKLKIELLIIAICTFAAAFILSFLFTYLRTKKNKASIWNNTTRRLLVSMFVPLGAGGIFVLRMADLGIAGLIAPGCLIFYGLALFCAGRYTFGEIRYLGYCEIVLGLINLFFIGYGLWFWAIGFGILHIIYGVVMWAKYERKKA